MSLTDFGDADGTYPISHIASGEPPTRPHTGDDNIALVEGTPKGSTVPYSEHPDHCEEWRL